MEEAAKSIEILTKHYLPFQSPYCLSLSTTRRYRPHPDEKRLEEQDVRPLQYTTFLNPEADRGVLITRAHFDVREDPTRVNNAPTTTPLRNDPNKVKKKVSLKDYKNRKTDGDSPPKTGGPSDKLATLKEKEAPKKLPELAATEMDGHRDAKSTTNTKPLAHRQRTPSPDRKRRVADTEESLKPAKRLKVGDATPSNAGARPSKDTTPQKNGRIVSSTKSDGKDLKPQPVTNGRSALSNLGKSGASPKPASQVNGSQKHTASSVHKKVDNTSTPNSRSLPPLLSPTLAANVSDLVKEDAKSSRPSPKKKPAETNSLKPQPKKLRDDREPSPSSKKRKIPPLLSPTLPAMVMEELARVEKRTPSKEPAPRSSQVSDSSGSIKKPAKPSKHEDTIHVDSKKGEPDQHMVTIKYKKRMAKTIERLLALPPGGKKKAEALKDRAAGDRAGSVEPGTARKRPRTATDVSEASKRPRTSDSLRPSTPPRQATSMTRVASSSFQAGTPGVTNSLTPAPQVPAERRRPPDPDTMHKVHALQAGHKSFMELGTKLKHERDAILKARMPENDRERQVAIAAGVQSLLAYMHAVKLQSDVFDLQRQVRRPQPWKEVLALFRVIRNDCSRHNQLSALLLRIQGICLVWLGRSMWFYTNDPDVMKEANANSKEQYDIWRLADHARKSMGIHDDSPEWSDGGAVGKLLDRLGPWTSPDESIPIALAVLRKIIRIDGSWKPAEELVNIGRLATNGVPN
ncbi:Uu.00g066050.m01.CDS01 [Anthostomella pinea]|uniref:Uu.00g066050.m01.CDS01 n=1 Tax=Anthostomella pinea TaxID=933095 RepID=A0AAI8VUP6_9PEZI|nr:Uu.00g066050.m01.CDS01 [Anthostomella pinea]